MCSASTTRDLADARFLMDTKELVLERGWTYSSTLYLALLEECVSREDYKLGYMIMEVSTCGREGERGWWGILTKGA